MIILISCLFTGNFLHEVGDFLIFLILNCFIINPILLFSIHFFNLFSCYVGAKLIVRFQSKHNNSDDLSLEKSCQFHFVFCFFLCVKPKECSFLHSAFSGLFNFDLCFLFIGICVNLVPVFVKGNERWTCSLLRKHLFLRINEVRKN